MISKKDELNNSIYDYFNHYIALDWSEKTMAIARMNPQSLKAKVIEENAQLSSLKSYLQNLKGSKILTIEETTSTHWLYVELKDHVDKILICDPYRNGLLKEGPKTDKIDAGKLCFLLRSGLLKEVYHSSDQAYSLRKLMSAYNDVVKQGVRAKNQKSALYRSLGQKYKEGSLKVEDEMIKFIHSMYETTIKNNEESKQHFHEVFNNVKKKNQTVRQLMTVSGIGVVWAITIYSTVVDARRFKNKYKYYSYCGLAYNWKESGGRNYGKKKPRYSRELKRAYISATYSAIGGNNDINHYYTYMINKGIDIKKAINIVARYIAKSTYAIMKNKENYKPYTWREQ